MNEERLHQVVGLHDPESRLIICPDCGQQEVWTQRECEDHGICRHFPDLEQGCCPVCGEEWPPTLDRDKKPPS